MPRDRTEEELSREVEQARQSLVYNADMNTPVMEVPEWVMTLMIVLVEFSAVYSVALHFAQK